MIFSIVWFILALIRLLIISSFLLGFPSAADRIEGDAFPSSYHPTSVPILLLSASGRPISLPSFSSMAGAGCDLPQSEFITQPLSLIRCWARLLAASISQGRERRGESGSSNNYVVSPSAKFPPGKRISNTAFLFAAIRGNCLYVLEVFDSICGTHIQLETFCNYYRWLSFDTPQLSENSRLVSSPLSGRH